MDVCCVPRPTITTLDIILSFGRNSHLRCSGKEISQGRQKEFGDKSLGRGKQSATPVCASRF
jgi:hypothetical protein